MDIKKIKAEDIDKMSTEEKVQYVRELIALSKEGKEVKGAFYNPHSNTIIQFTDVIDELGEEEAVKVIVSALEKSTNNKRTITKEDFDTLKERIENGTASEEDKYLMSMVDKISDDYSNEMQYQTNAIGTTLALIDFAQKIPKFNPTLRDIAITCDSLLLTVLSYTSGTQTHNYLNDLFTLSNIAENMAEDIVKTWKESLTSPVSPEMLVAALSHALVKACVEADITVPPATEVFDYLGIEKSTFISDDEEENDEE